jgi:hypothetical protein
LVLGERIPTPSQPRSQTGLFTSAIPVPAQLNPRVSNVRDLKDLWSYMG